ncbi:alpha/beta fold hydrolase [Kitasatospora griseola]|uniref:alpha/beta fold hydrolase n=1 Tax=Kitasatospora griseola TaxID=2064 RepID=UPI001670B74F|nr:alpha/beta fold hydrolase [Kitasatospora griseola]GGQ79159.1 hypothetical protein GCM10010195_38640 [Kitasatospora griseola]
MTENLLIDAAGIRLTGLAAGPVDAPVLVLLHGLGLGAADFAGVLPELAADRRVLALDLRGHGGSDRPGAYTLELLCDDVLAALDTLGPARVDLCWTCWNDFRSTLAGAPEVYEGQLYGEPAGSRG